MLKKFFLALFILTLSLGISYAKDRQGEVTFKIKIDAPEESKDVRLWVPYPVSDNEQSIDDIKIEGNYTYSGIYGQKQAGDLALYAEWTKPAKERFLTFTFKAKTMERIKREISSNVPVEESGIPVEIKAYLTNSSSSPADDKIKAIATNITRGKKTVLEKAMAIYDWTIENTFRDNSIKGCGTGDIEKILSAKGGKCVDIGGLYVAVAAAAGVPAREVWGFGLSKKAEDDITNSHNCWVEFYLPGHGWVPLDPAYVRKMMLNEKLEMKDAKKYRDYYFGAVGDYMIALTRGRKGYNLNPQQKGGTIPYGFMYPYAEIERIPVEWLAAQKELKYQITFKEK